MCLFLLFVFLFFFKVLEALGIRIPISKSVFQLVLMIYSYWKHSFAQSDENCLKCKEGKKNSMPKECNFPVCPFQPFFVFALIYSLYFWHHEEL